MKREIKFRAWGQQTSQMVFFEIGENPLHKMLEQSVEVMQFTGLKDKNGKEAYHKDVVRYDGDLWVMEWNGNSACFELLSIDGNEVTGMDFSMKFEVIGNIYENPDLLKG